MPKIENLREEIENLKVAQRSEIKSLNDQLDAQRSDYTAELDALRSEIKSLNDDSSLEGFFKSYRVFYVLLIFLCSFVQDSVQRTYWVWCLLLAVCFFFVSLVREMPTATIKSIADTINDTWIYETKCSLLYLTALRGILGNSSVKKLFYKTTTRKAFVIALIMITVTTCFYFYAVWMKDSLYEMSKSIIWMIIWEFVLWMFMQLCNCNNPLASKKNG